MGIKKFLNRLYSDSGQTSVAATLGILLIIGFVALAVEVGHLYNVKRQVQLAADAAAIAGALEIQTCAGNTNCDAMRTAAQAALTENGFSGSTVVTNCGTSSGGLTLTVNNPPCALGAGDPNKGNPDMWK